MATMHRITTGIAAALVVAGLAVGQSGLRGETAKRKPTEDKPQAAEPKPAEAHSGGETKREIEANAGNSVWDNKRQLWVLTPNAKIGIPQVTIREIGEDHKMVADRVEYDDRNDTARGTGHLIFSDPDTTITGELVVVDFNQKLATITGSVRMTSHGEEPEEDDEEDTNLPLKDRYRNKKTVVDCNQLDYWYKERRAEAEGNLRFRQGDKHGTAGKAIYFEKDDLLLLEGEVNVTNEKGETAKAPQVTIDNKADTMVAEQGVTVRFFVEEEEEEGAESSGDEKSEATAETGDKPESDTGKGTETPKQPPADGETKDREKPSDTPAPGADVTPDE